MTTKEQVVTFDPMVFFYKHKSFLTNISALLLSTSATRSIILLCLQCN